MSMKTSYLPTITVAVTLIYITQIISTVASDDFILKLHQVISPMLVGKTFILDECEHLLYVSVKWEYGRGGDVWAYRPDSAVSGGCNHRAHWWWRNSHCTDTSLIPVTVHLVWLWVWSQREASSLSLHQWHLLVYWGTGENKYLETPCGCLCPPQDNSEITETRSTSTLFLECGLFCQTFPTVFQTMRDTRLLSINNNNNKHSSLTWKTTNCHSVIHIFLGVKQRETKNKYVCFSGFMWKNNRMSRFSIHWIELEISL